MLKMVSLNASHIVYFMLLIHCVAKISFDTTGCIVWNWRKTENGIDSFRSKLNIFLFKLKNIGKFPFLLWKCADDVNVNNNVVYIFPKYFFCDKNNIKNSFSLLELRIL